MQKTRQNDSFMHKNLVNFMQKDNKLIFFLHTNHYFYMQKKTLKFSRERYHNLLNVN